MLKHSIKICKCTTKEIKKELYYKGSASFQKLKHQDRANYRALSHTASLGIIHTKCFSAYKCTPLDLPQRTERKGHSLCYFFNRLAINLAPWRQLPTSLSKHQVSFLKVVDPPLVKKCQYSFSKVNHDSTPLNSPNPTAIPPT